MNTQYFIYRPGPALKVFRLFLLALLLCSPLSFLQAKDYTVETVPNVRLSNRMNHVSNPDGIISSPDVARINQMLNRLEDSLGIEVAVVAVNSIGDNDARSFATDLFNRWGLGKKGKDNGLLIQLVTEPSQRSIVFETGYGLEGILPDAISYRLQQQYMMPDLKAGRYSTAMVNGVTAVTNYLMASDYERVAAGGTAVPHGSFFRNAFMGFAVMFFFIIILTLFSYRRHPKRICPRCGKKTLTYAGQNVIKDATGASEGLVEDVYRCTNCGYTENKNRRNYRSRRGFYPLILGGGLGGLGGGLGGGFGGGFGGGGSWGGGGSGGGGAIGRF